MKKIFKALFIASTLALAMPLISCSDDDGGSSAPVTPTGIIYTKSWIY